MAKIDELLNDPKFKQLMAQSPDRAKALVLEMRQKDFGKIPNTENLLQRAIKSAGTFNIGGLPAMSAGLSPEQAASGVAEVLPAAGQTIGGGFGGYPGAVGGTALGELGKQGLQSYLGGTEFQPQKVIAPTLATAAIEGATRGIGKIAGPAANRLMISILRPTSKILSKHPDIGLQAIKEGLIGTERGITSSAERLIQEGETKLNQVLSSHKGQVDILDIAASLDHMKSGYLNAGEENAVNAINQVQNNLLSKSPTGKISVMEANQLKKDLYSTLSPNQWGTPDVAYSAEARKSAASGLKKGIESSVPEYPIAEINRKIGLGSMVKSSMKKESARQSKNTISPFWESGGLMGGIGTTAMGHPGIGLPILAGLGARRVLGSTPVKSGLAFLLSKIAKSGATGIGRITTSEAARRLLGG